MAVCKAAPFRFKRKETSIDIPEVSGGKASEENLRRTIQVLLYPGRPCIYSSLERTFIAIFRQSLVLIEPATAAIQNSNPIGSTSNQNSNLNLKMIACAMLCKVGQD